MEIIQNTEFKLSQNIFSKGIHLKGSKIMDSNLSIEEEKLCINCKDYLGKLNCRYLGKIKVPSVICCSFWKDKKLNLKVVRGYRNLK